METSFEYKISFISEGSLTLGLERSKVLSACCSFWISTKKKIADFQKGQSGSSLLEMIGVGFDSILHDFWYLRVWTKVLC